MKKQTAVEWLLEKLNNVKPTDFCSIETIKEWCNQSKAMEREQIIDAYWNGTTDIEKGKAVKEGIEFYNETYGGEQ